MYSLCVRKLLPQADFAPLRSVVINLITAGVAAGLLANRRRNKPIRLRSWPPEKHAPLVDIIIPARNEERNIGALLETLIQQTYPRQRWRATVIDDNSGDATSLIANSYALSQPNVRCVPASPLPAGWTGKNHAMYTGLLSSQPQADYVLFVDADTRHDPRMLSSVILRALETDCALLSLVIKVDMESFWERLLVPEVGELYTLLVGTMDSVNRLGRGRGAAANGQFMLIRPDEYRQVMANTGIRQDVAEDRAIASALKRQGKTVRLEYGQALVHSRVYSSIHELWAGYSKTMFWASGRDTPRTLAVALALLFYAFTPLVTLSGALTKCDPQARSNAARHGALQILPMTALRAVVCRWMGVPIAYAGAYPLAVLIGVGMLLYSQLRVISGRGVSWKGRTYR